MVGEIRWGKRERQKREKGEAKQNYSMGGLFVK